MRILYSAVAAAAALCVNISWAQVQAPDAGRLLQEDKRRPEPPPRSPALNLQSPPSSPSTPGVGGPAVAVQAISIEGLSLLDPVEIAGRLAPPAGRAMDLAGMRELAQQVEAVVRARGLPFARAYLPPQNLAGGVLRIAVVEGRYGEVRVAGERQDAAQPWLAPLRPGEPILVAPLERSLLLLNDLPGVEASSVLRPGAAPGTGDLQVEVASQRRVSGEAGIDNHGNRYAGRERVRAGIDIASPFGFGDQLGMRASYNVEGTWLASLAYSVPVGTSGWRAQASLSRSDYELGKEFASLQAHGTADVLTAGFAYPILRTQDTNLRATFGLQAKRLHDGRDAVGVSERKRSWLLPLVLGGDHRDHGSVTWGSVALNFGRLDLDAALAAADETSARTQGRFTKLNLDLARVQGLAPGWNWFGRLSTQWADRNLDSSEKFVLGGPYGVRGWPTGEASGDAGWLVQTELRWRVGEFEPYLFADAGGVRINRSPWTAGSNQRDIQGAGLGGRWAHGPWSADLALAWRLGGDPSTSEPDASRMRAWLTAGYRF